MGRRAREAIEWASDNALNLFAYLVLRASPPARAKIWVDRLGRMHLSVMGTKNAEQMMRRLNRRGTCLSRALAVAACLPGSEVVIGVARSSSPPIEVNSRDFAAHAWVELGGIPVDEDEKAGWFEVARMPSTRLRRATVIRSD